MVTRPDDILSAFARSNTGPSQNTYLWQDEAWTLAEARQAGPSSPLAGLPVSVKDCFDLAGSPTSLGTRFYQQKNGIATQDSWLVERLRASGAVIMGKTHLHPLAYGITGENAEFGDCIQPGNPGNLTGGSSSGAVASVLEGSAYAAIGTDTGGSVRVPAALSGLVGYRASWGRGDWRGGYHLAESFDTFGWLFRHLADAPLLGSLFDSSLFGGVEATNRRPPTTFAVVPDAFLHDCDPLIVANLRRCQASLEALGLTAQTINVDWWADSREIFAPIQASEACRHHAGHFDQFEGSIRQRLTWGQSLAPADVIRARQRHAEFRDRMDDLLATYSLLLLPAAPVTRLAAGADHAETRPRLLRYTTPLSLSGMPVLSLPYFENGRPAGGMQLAAAREDDARLLALAAALAPRRTL